MCGGTSRAAAVPSTGTLVVTALAMVAVAATTAGLERWERLGRGVPPSSADMAVPAHVGRAAVAAVAAAA